MSYTIRPTIQDQRLTEEEHNSNLQWAYVEKLNGGFVGRKNLIDELLSKILKTQSGVIGLVGKLGTGKTALLVSSPNAMAMNNYHQV